MLLSTKSYLDLQVILIVCPRPFTLAAVDEYKNQDVEEP